MRYSGKIEYADARKMRQRNTRLYRSLHTPIWIWVFFLAPGPLTFSLFAHGFSLWNGAWLAIVLTCVFIAAYFGQLPGCEPRPYILRFDEDRPNPLYRKICYTFAWNAVVNFALLNLTGLIIAVVTGHWMLKQIYTYAYSPICAIILFLGLMGKLPRVGPSTKREGTERRYFYGSVWAVTIAQTVLLIVWKSIPASPTASIIRLVAYVAMLVFMGLAAWQGVLPRTRPILPGELITE
jgi:energy-converting hydrogenase Eha subunit C